MPASVIPAPRPGHRSTATIIADVFDMHVNTDWTSYLAERTSATVDPGQPG